MRQQMMIPDLNFGPLNSAQYREILHRQFESRLNVTLKRSAKCSDSSGNSASRRIVKCHKKNSRSLHEVSECEEG